MKVVVDDAEIWSTRNDELRLDIFHGKFPAAGMDNSRKTFHHFRRAGSGCIPLHLTRLAIVATKEVISIDQSTNPPKEGGAWHSRRWRYVANWIFGENHLKGKGDVMPPAAKKATVSGQNEKRFQIPGRLMEAFNQQPRVVIKWRPDGLWPIDPGMLKKVELLQKLLSDQEFNKKFEVVIMAKD